MLFSEVKGRKVVSTTTAETVGKVEDYVIDPSARQVVALLVKKAPHGKVLPWAMLTAVGADAVTVPGAEVIVDAADPGASAVAPLLGKEHRVRGKRVLTSAGDEIGEVRDVDFDGHTGQVLGLHLGGDHVVDGRRLRGVGSYAVVVDAATD